MKYEFKLTSNAEMKRLAKPYKDDISKKQKSSDLEYKTKSKKKYRYIATSSRCYSDADLVSGIIKNNIERSKQIEAKIIPVNEIILKESEKKLSDFNKAAILARKYKRHNYILNQLCRRRFLSDEQIKLIFTLVKQVKEVLNNDNATNA